MNAIGAGHEALRDAYVTLLRRTLMHDLWDPPTDVPPGKLDFLKRLAPSVFGRAPMTKAEAREGRGWPKLALTMIGEKRLSNLQECVETVIREGIPGDLIETGVWRGGACIFMRGMLFAHAENHRKVWVADSFRGLPPPDAGRYPADKGDKHHRYEELAISRAEVEESFRRFNLLDEQVQFLEGWFRDTLPSAPIGQLSVCRLDGDMYESTMDGLTHLYPRLAPGGFLIVDDFGAVPGCRKAVEDYRASHGIGEPLHQIDWTGVFWRKLQP